MKIIFLLILITIFNIGLFAQKCLNTPKKYPVDTSFFLKERTQSLFCAILLDSSFKNINYIINEYYAPITYYDGKTIRKIIKKRKMKADSIFVSDTVFYDPLNIDDDSLCGYSFDVKQSIDTNKLILNCVEQKQKMILIKKSQIEKKYALSIQEPPVFSKDYSRAIINVYIIAPGSGGGYQLLYIYENNIWKQVCSRCTWRS